MQESQDFLTLNEVAARWRVHRRTVEREIRAGRLKATKLGRRTLIAVDENERYVAALAAR